MLERLRSSPPARAVGEAVLDQRLVAGIGNLWKAESLWEARISPWRPLGGLEDRELLAVLDAAHRLMRTGVEGTRPLRHVYRRAGRACRRCGTVIRSHPQGDPPGSRTGAPAASAAEANPRPRAGVRADPG